MNGQARSAGNRCDLTSRDFRTGALRIGLTYDLRADYLARGFSEEETAELDQVGTIEAIEEALRALGHDTERLGHVEQLMPRLIAGERWDLVFNICEGLFGLGRESMVPSLLDHYRIPYTFSDPLTLAVCLHKGTAKSVLAAAGVPTPTFMVIESIDQLVDLEMGDVSTNGLEFPLFAKPVAEGTGKGIDGRSIIVDAGALRSKVSSLLEAFRQPVLVETFLPGRELTVGIVGTGEDARAVGVLEVHLLSSAESGVYSYVNKERCEELVEYRLVEDTDELAVQAGEIALRAWRALGCRDGGRVDLRCAANGQPQLLEINPLAGLHPLHSDLPILCTKAGMEYQELIGQIVEAARERVLTSGTALRCAS